MRLQPLSEKDRPARRTQFGGSSTAVVYRIAIGPVVSNELDMSPIYSDCLMRRASGIFSKIDDTASLEPIGTETFVNASTNFIF